MSHPLTPEEIDMLLPLYVCGECTDDERAVIEQAIADDADLKQQYYELRSTLGLLHDGVNQEPAPVLNADKKAALLALEEPKAVEQEGEAEEDTPGVHFSVFARWFPRESLAMAAGLLLCASVVSALLMPALNSAKSKSRAIALKHEARMERIVVQSEMLEEQEDASNLRDADNAIVSELASEARPERMKKSKQSVDGKSYDHLAGGPAKAELNKDEVEVFYDVVVNEPASAPEPSVVAPGVGVPRPKSPVVTPQKKDNRDRGIRLDYWTENTKTTGDYLGELRETKSSKPGYFSRKDTVEKTQKSLDELPINGSLRIGGTFTLQVDAPEVAFEDTGEELKEEFKSKPGLAQVFEENTAIKMSEGKLITGDLEVEKELAEPTEVMAGEKNTDVVFDNMRQRSDYRPLPSASQFKVFPVNPFVLTAKDQLSTFALESDTASFTLGRSYIRRGYRPPAGSVRMEEYINAFDYAYSPAGKQTFTMYSQLGKAPFGENLALVKIGVKGKVIGRDSRKSAHVVLAVDTSGSMAQADRLPLIKQTLTMLVQNLADTDTVSLVSYGDKPELVLDHALAKDAKPIIAAIQQLEATGPTNLMHGLGLAYQRASHYFRAEKVNRVVLCSDGVATVGEAAAETLLQQVGGFRKQGIFLTVAGFGTGAYNDGFMDTLANKGDGSYTFIDSLQQAKTVFVKQLDAALFTIAKDVKIQVNFNPQRVRRYRLIGYENRDIADNKFRDDTVDAGEIGSGQSATALYEVEIIGENRDAMGSVAVRYQNLDTGDIEEVSHRIMATSVTEKSVADYPYYYLAACVAEWAEVLRRSEYVQPGSEEKIEQILQDVARALPHNDQVKSLLRLVASAKGLPTAP